MRHNRSLPELEKLASEIEEANSDTELLVNEFEAAEVLDSSVSVLRKRRWKASP